MVFDKPDKLSLILSSQHAASMHWMYTPRPDAGHALQIVRGALVLMVDDLGYLWEKTLAELQNDLLKPSAETWLKSAKPLALYEDTVVIGLPNEFVREWVESRYAPGLKRVMQRLTSRDMDIRFVVPPETSAASADAPREPNPVQDVAANISANGATRLNPKYTFETFVVGQSNRFAHAAALAVSTSPARAYNPLFIYGGVGLGKTHLMHALGHQVMNVNPARKVCYVSTETFTNELISSIRDGRTSDFRSRYRNVDVLLIDDVQFLTGKEGTQEELFHTFDALHQASKQIVISSDRPPREIATLEDRLRTRFEWGLVSDIQPPDLETRMAILRKKAVTEKFSIPDDVAAHIAQTIKTNIRELEGALVRVLAYSSLTKRTVNLELTVEALRDIYPDTPRMITIDLIQKTVADYYSLNPQILKEKKRTRAVAFPRQVAMYLCRELTDASLPKIGEEFGGRDHSTVIHACDKIIADISSDPMLATTIRQLTSKIRGQ